MMHENFSSLSLFTKGPKKQVKICELNKLIVDYSVDVLAGCKTRTNWQFVTDKDSRFPNLFGNGQPSQGVYAHNTNNIQIKQDQWGGTCITAVGCFSTFVVEEGKDSTELG
jgi:hypothetical protein